MPSTPQPVGALPPQRPVRGLCAGPPKVWSVTTAQRRPLWDRLFLLLPAAPQPQAAAKGTLKGHRALPEPSPLQPWLCLQSRSHRPLIRC